MMNSIILSTGKALVALTVLAGSLSCNKDKGNDNPSPKPAPKETRELSQKTLIKTGVADPCLNYVDGKFYLIATGSTKLNLQSGLDLGSISSSKTVYDASKDPTVVAQYGAGAKIQGTWSPEIHYISDEDCPGYAGWYLYFALRKKEDDSRYVRMVVLKSTSGSIEGPYANPVTYTEGESQVFLDRNDKVIDEWTLGPSLLRIPSGEYQGLYLTWVDEVGRGTGKGNFYQRLRIAKLAKPWKMESGAATITTPTQAWERKGSDSIRPEVVEGGTAVYGDNGEIFLTYCGSGYWSDYGLGQLTLKKSESGDYLDPLLQDSWVKYENNPIFSSVNSEDTRGAGHGFFFRDAEGQRLMAFHAYPFSLSGGKGSSRNSYVEPYSIDYNAKSATAPDGVIRMGILGTGVVAPSGTEFKYHIYK